MVNMYREMGQLGDDLISKHIESYDENQTRDFIDAYLHQANEKASDSNSSFNEQNARKHNSFTSY
jgi:hypothetical protein